MSRAEFDQGRSIYIRSSLKSADFQDRNLKASVKGSAVMGKQSPLRSGHAGETGFVDLKPADFPSECWKGKLC